MFLDLKSYLMRYYPLNTFQWFFIKKIAKPVAFSKGEVIHEIGEICNKIFFIESGLIRGYVLDTKGKDYTWHLFFNDEKARTSNLLVVDYDSFIHQTPSKIGLEVLESSKLLMFEKRDIERLFATRFGAIIGLKITQEAYSTLHNYIISYATENAKERYETFMEHSAHWFDLVPQHYIATHLGMTPQSLSRLKRASDKR